MKVKHLIEYLQELDGELPVKSLTDGIHVVDYDTKNMRLGIVAPCPHCLENEINNELVIDDRTDQGQRGNCLLM